MPDLAWLPAPERWSERLAALRDGAPWDMFVELANTNLTAARTNALERALKDRFTLPPEGLARPPMRLAVLGSATVSHLLPAIRVAGLRRGMWIDIYEGNYGAYKQEILDPNSGLYAFRPDEILLVLDAVHATAGMDAADDTSRAHEKQDDFLNDLAGLWKSVRERLGCALIQQTIMPTPVPLVGLGERLLPGSRVAAVDRLNACLSELADAEKVDLLPLNPEVLRHGLTAWHEPVWWLRAKQEIAPTAAPYYGDLVARILAARRGLSRKALVLDLDNTLWGGVVGDDGPTGLVLGAGSAEGEAFVSFQQHVRELAKRGIILAVVSKNDEANAVDAFDHHPEMVLRREEIAVFIANWKDKAENISAVAALLGIGRDAIVFVDDNPFERDRVRTALPEIAVPELPEDPSGYASRIAQAGYFEALAVTVEDRARGSHYAAAARHREATSRESDLSAYLASLDMRLLWRAFTIEDLPRIVQLVNKTNQFNLTTRRITENEARAFLTDPDLLTLRFRLVDRLADNGIIGIIIGRRVADSLVIESWLMSCRVIGRGVEMAMFEVLKEAARGFGLMRLVGVYRPTLKNELVRDLYPKLGFHRVEVDKLNPGIDDEKTQEFECNLSRDNLQVQALSIIIVPG